ncbi:hypothetical protein [Microbulbifer spongiae]|uniref:Uncharacterized protein n=1 Tax=Microbulbifer spongiae TaxID=2944933 RepID=A0ABY9EI14_9GAMM|nr:hypothetical protein [Microbulbifer sp. MI-G]WKD51464.1 hypothetical protein M8T91_08620 [Microbulbifer sp. MI-G]
MSLDVNQLISNIKDTASTIIAHDITEIRGFSERQLSALALQAQLITKAILNREINEDLRDYFLDSLEDMALNFAKTLRGLLAVTIEKVWNAIVGVLWSAIEACTGISLKVAN